MWNVIRVNTKLIVEYDLFQSDQGSAAGDISDEVGVFPYIVKNLHQSFGDIHWYLKQLLIHCASFKFEIICKATVL